MKKFMKAIALATVLCLALSTVAFANSVDTAVKDSAKDYTVDVVVTGAISEEVALVIVDSTNGDVIATSGINDGNIVYIDQKTADASGTTFADVPIKDTVKRVSVFVGYDGIAATDNYLGTFDIGPEIKKINIVEDATIVSADDGIGLAIELQDLPDGATRMIWAMDVDLDGDGEGTAVRRYSSSVDLAGLQGGTALAAKIARGTSTITDAHISNVGAIILVGDVDTGDVYFTDEDDAANKAPSDN